MTHVAQSPLDDTVLSFPSISVFSWVGFLFSNHFDSVYGEAWGWTSQDCALWPSTGTGPSQLGCRSSVWASGLSCSHSSFPGQVQVSEKEQWLFSFFWRLVEGTFYSTEQFQGLSYFLFPTTEDLRTIPNFLYLSLFLGILFLFYFNFDLCSHNMQNIWLTAIHFCKTHDPQFLKG